MSEPLDKVADRGYNNATDPQALDELRAYVVSLRETARLHPLLATALFSLLNLAAIAMVPLPSVTKAIPFAGGEGTHSVLSILNGAHSIGEGILGFFTMVESNALRGVCKEFRKALMDFPWMDAESIIRGSLMAWRAAFPAARAVNVTEGYVGRRKPIVDEDFVHIRGDARARLHTVDMRECIRVTDAAFVHLRGIQSLNMVYCNPSTITDAAFVHLRGIHILDMSKCNQATITDAAFMNLHGIHTIGMGGCNQATITDAAFVHLRGIHTFSMSNCKQITDAAFVHLRGILKLEMESCFRITDAAFVHLRGIQKLNMAGCNQMTITDAAFVHLHGIHTLDMSRCNQATITDAAFVHLRGIRVFTTYDCRPAVRTAAAAVLSLGLACCD